MVIERIQVNIFNTRTEMGIAAAKAVAATIHALLQQQQEVNIVFAAAPSQNEFLDALATHAIDWQRVNAFHMDEYIGLEATSPVLFARYLRTRLFEKVNCKTVNYICSSNPNPGEECLRYTALLQNYPADIVCMGIGENNHIAFNDPPVANFSDPLRVKIAALDEDCRRQQVNDGCFPVLEAVPGHAITLTVPALLDTKYIFCIVPGERKARAVYNTFYEPIIELYPSTALRKHPNVVMFLDKESSSRL
ncbi:MAG TPA: glucosamine-6-phosphate deaminase [Chitinophagaceae bacterium]|nr:glucosamine-6-phosphate deaminase [Chitinophagaceae bacterium]